MAIVSNVPFELKVIRTYPLYKEYTGVLFFNDENDIWSTDETTFSVEENEEISMFFNSADSDARLYISSLDIVNYNDEHLKEDEDGHIFRTPSEKSFYLYKSEPGYDVLRVDEMLITVECDEKKYYGKLRVLPKPVSLNEWYMMRDDIESEMRGLSQDLLKNNIGLGGKNNAVLPPKLMYDFFIIEKYSSKILPALIDISENPRYEIKTYYERVSKKNADEQSYDAETIKQIVRNSGSEVTINIPIKKSEFDIQDNRILKMILTVYEKKLEKFISIMESAGLFSLLSGEKEKVSKGINEKSIEQFKEIALKLKKITSIIRTQSWYSGVGMVDSPYIPHSLIMDTRYNIIYQMYQELRKDELRIEFDSRFSYTWKRSSLLYEMWCYFKICRLLLKDYEIESENWNIMLDGKFLFPFLESGTKVSFINDKCIIELIYDRPLPKASYGVSLEEPLYIAHRTDFPNHNRPDILMNVYDHSKSMYMGSVIFECKYRKLNSFWNSGERSSRGQLEAYYNNARSTLLYGGIGDIFNMRPVNKVVALTPDILGEGTKGEDFHIIVKAFKPSEENDTINLVYDLIDEEIREMLKKSDKIREIKLQ